MLLDFLPALITPAPVDPTVVGLIDGDGRPFTLAEQRGRWLWLYLGYASCPDACPRTLDALIGAYAGLTDPDRVVPVFVSVDPLRDTPARLKAYAGFYHPRLLAASGPRGAIDTLVEGLGARYEVPKDAKPDGAYVVGHPNEIFVFDPQGRYVARVDADRPDLGAALAEARTAPPLSGPPPASTAALCGTLAAEAFSDPNPLRDPRMHRAATMGSGTSVLPAATPMRMWPWRVGDWLVLGALDAAPSFVASTGDRGRWAFTAENQLMAMGTRALGPGLLDLRTMGSLDAWTLAATGTPQLFQGMDPPDRRHPHDAVMELAARYTWTPSPAWSAFLYGGPVGEPALGPAAFAHRPSAAENHWAPLGHHVQDHAHVTHGVITAGARVGEWQLEGSTFRGREPDDDRVGLDMGPLDSWSGRLTWFPGRHLTAQVSQGALRDVEAMHPGETVRTTASLATVYNTPLGRWSASLIGGQDRLTMADMALDPLRSVAAESQLDWAGRHHLYGRYEWLERAGTPPFVPDSHGRNRVEALTLGYARDLGDVTRLALALGGDVTVYGLEPYTMSAYGPGPVQARVFLRLRPPTTTHPDDRDPIADGP